MNFSEFGSSWLGVQTADSRDGARVPWNGTWLEMEIKATPQMRDGPIRKCFCLVRNLQINRLEISDVECDKGMFS
jgi:hypothetical protein